MKKWQIENSEISEKLFRVFLFPSFRFCPTAKIENSDLKFLEKNFRGFLVFDMAFPCGDLRVVQCRALKYFFSKDGVFQCSRGCTKKFVLVAKYGGHFL